MSDDIDVVDTSQEAPESSPVDSEARLLGWVPKEEFRGPEEHWIDSDTFVERGRQILPIVKKNNEELKRKLLALESKDRERDQTITEWKAFVKETQSRERESLTQEIAMLKEQKKVAISDGNGDAVIDIDDAIDAVKERQRAVKETPVQVSTQPDPSFIEWVEDNTWYGNDVDKTAYANGIGPVIQKDFPMLRGKPFLDMVASKVLEKFPIKSTRSASVESGGSPTSPRGKKGYANLPADAKVVHDKFVKQGLMSSDEYIASYDWS